MKSRNIPTHVRIVRRETDHRGAQNRTVAAGVGTASGSAETHYPTHTVHLFLCSGSSCVRIRRALHSPSGKAEQRKTDPVRQHGDNCRTALCDNNEPQHRKNHQPEHQWAAADQLFRQHHGRALGSVCNTAASRRGDSGGSAAPVTHLWPGGSHGRSTIQYQLDTKCDWYSARRVSVVAVRIVGCNEATRTGREHGRSGRKAAKRPTRPSIIKALVLRGHSHLSRATLP